MDLEKRKYYVQKYDFTMMGFLIDENEFEVSPAISRTLTVIEVDQRNIKRPQKKRQPVELEQIVLKYLNGSTSEEYNFEYTCNLYFTQSTNVDSYSVYINNEYYGDNVNLIQINTNDILQIEIVGGIGLEIPELIFSQKLI
jgi:hypothetical protein